jgi:hypothetical protein
MLFLAVGNSQSYVFHSFEPFGIQLLNMEDTSRFAYKYMFHDMDADGDVDLFLFGLDESDTIATNSQLENLNYFIEVQENTGNKWNPAFAPRQRKFEAYDFASGNSFFFPTMGDLNGDGLIDLVVSAYADENFIQSVRFDIQSGDYAFETHLGSEYELASFNRGSIFLPELIDLDMDGDLDLLMSGGARSVFDPDSTINIHLYAKNIGTPAQPDFLGWFPNPYGFNTLGEQAFFCGGDLDMDGDTDLLGIRQKDSLQQLVFFENTPGADGKPAFAGVVEAGFGLPQNKYSGEGFYFPSPVDLDGDGDLDLILPHLHIDEREEGGTLYLDTLFNLFYYENVLCNEEQQYEYESICPGDTFYVGEQAYFESGTWDIETVHANGCRSVLHLTLEVFPSIDVQLTQDGTLLSAEVEPGYSYQWFDCDTGKDIPGADGSDFEPSYTGHFAVIITDEYGCMETSDCYYVDLTGVEQARLLSEIVIVPNPATEAIRIIHPAQISIRVVEFYGLSGESVLSIRPEPGQTLDLSGLASGVYLVRIVTGDNREKIRRLILLDKNEE